MNKFAFWLLQHRFVHLLQSDISVLRRGYLVPLLLRQLIVCSGRYGERDIWCDRQSGVCFVCNSELHHCLISCEWPSEIRYSQANCSWKYTRANGQKRPTIFTPPQPFWELRGNRSNYNRIGCSSSSSLSDRPLHWITISFAIIGQQ